VIELILILCTWSTVEVLHGYCEMIHLISVLTWLVRILQRLDAVFTAKPQQDACKRRCVVDSSCLSFDIRTGHEVHAFIDCWLWEA
jgi:hypothetical protein